MPRPVHPPADTFTRAFARLHQPGLYLPREPDAFRLLSEEDWWQLQGARRRCAAVRRYDCQGCGAEFTNPTVPSGSPKSRAWRNPSTCPECRKSVRGCP